MGQGHSWQNCLCVSVVVTACGKVSNNRPTLTLCGRILHRYVLTAAQGVTRFACQSSGPPPVTVRSFVWASDWPPATLLMFLHILAASNTTAEEEWGGYEACVRVTAALEGMCLRGCIYWHCCGQTGVSVLPPVCPRCCGDKANTERALLTLRCFISWGKWKMLKTNRKHSRHEAPVFLSFSFSCYEFLDLCPWAGYLTETVWIMWLKWKGLVFWAHVNDSVEKCHLSRSWLGGGVFLLGISGQVSVSVVASSTPSCRQQLNSVTAA